jgi:hypothetical protein
MSTVVYRNVVVLLDGAQLNASLAELSVEYSAEMLDNTHFGDDTRVRKGGLLMATISGRGHAEFGAGAIEAVLFDEMDDEEVVLAVFPNSVTEGATAEGTGYAMKGVLSEFYMGEAVGGLLALSFTAQSRGIGA